MDNYIGKRGNYFDAYWVIHGTPQGWEANDRGNVIAPIASYVNFHRGGDTHINPYPSVPGAKFIKEEIPAITGGFAYTFLRTGIHQITSDRDGSNYGAITIVMDDIADEKLETFEKKLEQWFKENILKKFTYETGNGWLKWNDKARGLFRGDYNEQLKNSIQSLIQPYLQNQNTASNGKSSDVVKTDGFNAGTQKQKEEIAKLEQQKQEIERQLAEKYAQLENV